LTDPSLELQGLPRSAKHDHSSAGLLLWMFPVDVVLDSRRAVGWRCFVLRAGNRR